MPSRRDLDEHPFGPAVATLIAEFTRLPGIGKRSAERLTYHVLNVPKDEAMDLANAIIEMRKSIRRCEVCHNIAEGDRCGICKDDRRDKQSVCVVEQPKDITVIESTGAYDGVYHVLGGRISPLDGIGPEDLTIDALVQRVRKDGVREIIMATNPTLEGDGTALYLSNVLGDLELPDGESLRVTRLARGIATGSVLEFANSEMLADAMRGRQSF